MTIKFDDPVNVKQFVLYVAFNDCAPRFGSIKCDTVFSMVELDYPADPSLDMAAVEAMMNKWQIPYRWINQY